MRKYVELFEGSFLGEGDYIRVDVTEWSVDDIERLLSLLRDIGEENYVTTSRDEGGEITVVRNYSIMIHYCFHDEGEECIYCTELSECERKLEIRRSGGLVYVPPEEALDYEERIIIEEG